MDLATRLLDRGAEVHNPGRHASLVGAGAEAVNTDMASVTAASLHSYPLMWAVAAALRSDSTVKVGPATHRSPHHTMPIK